MVWSVQLVYIVILLLSRQTADKLVIASVSCVCRLSSSKLPQTRSTQQCAWSLCIGTADSTGTTSTETLFALWTFTLLHAHKAFCRARITLDIGHPQGDKERFATHPIWNTHTHMQKSSQFRLCS
uniref:Secreted protein n=1 Tax=Rhipicephalus appendiculatus TaxID=34631 RepID=A0A131Z4P6_RHIAP